MTHPEVINHTVKRYLASRMLLSEAVIGDLIFPYTAMEAFLWASLVVARISASKPRHSLQVE